MSYQQAADRHASVHPHEAPGRVRGKYHLTALEDSGKCQTDWLHSGWRIDRQLVYAALLRVHGETPATTAFAMCGSNAWVMESVADPGHYRIAADYCRSRWCRICARRRSQVIAANVHRLIQGQQARMVTLTLRSSATPLALQLERLRRAFRTLRRTRWWRARVTAGCWCMEVTLNERSGEWHVHVHSLVTGRYLPQAELSDAWRAVTGDSYVVDVRLIRSAEHAATYVAKYVAKPIAAQAYRDPVALDNAIRGYHGQRLVGTFGAWHRESLTAVPDSGEWVPLCSLADLQRGLARGSAWAHEIVRATAWHHSDDTPCARPPPPLPDGQDPRHVAITRQLSPSSLLPWVAAALTHAVERLSSDLPF